MPRRSLILMIISVLFSSFGYSQLLNNDDSLRKIIQRDGQAEVTLSFSDRNTLDLLSANVSITAIKGNLIYIRLSPLNVDWFIKQDFQYKISVLPRRKSVSTVSDTKQLKDWDVYPTYTQYDSLMQSFPKLFPSLCSLDTIGTSINGKLVLALRISGSHDWKPSVFYTSTMHGDETGGFMLMLHLADYLLNSYTTDEKVRYLVDNLEIWINPLSNPDGTYRNSNTIISPVRFNALGYDLNRNFPDPATPDIVMQKENKDMISFMRKHKFVLSANFHSGSEVVNYPWDRYTKLHTDDSWFYSISRAYADTAHVYGGPSYMNMLDNGVTRGSVWYKINGGRQDFTTSELHGREVTIEVDDQYITPETELISLWNRNKHSLTGYLLNALHGIHGLVRDIETHNPVPARIFIAGHDMDSSHVFSDTISGNFVRMIYPGMWDLTITAGGYLPVTIKDVLVANSEKTEMVVDMIRDKANSPTTEKLIIYPVPSKGKVSVLLPGELSGRIRIKIFDYTGRIISDYEDEAVHGIPLIINNASYSSGLYDILISRVGGGTKLHGRFIIVK